MSGQPPAEDHRPRATRSVLARLARRSSRVAAVMLVACIAVASGSMRGPTAHAAGRTLTVTPNTDLGNQVVTVHWTGFSTAFGVIVQQCKANPVSLADCET